MAAGCALLVAGALAAAGWLSWFGRLPGDIRYESGGVRIYVPIVSTLLVSAILTLIVNGIRRFL